MARKTRENSAVRSFILENVGTHPRDIARLTANRFGIPRQTAGRYLRKLTNESVLSAVGSTNARRYAIRDYVSQTARFDVTPLVEEHVVWRERVAPFLKDIPTNIYEICEHGVTEMVNNVIYHSGRALCDLTVRLNVHRVRIDIFDNGIGIFEKIRTAYHLDDPRLALLELSKGKLTTDSDGHSGEGIFFTSRMCNYFNILSGNLFYSRELVHDDDWLIEVETRPTDAPGTLISLEISRSATQTVQGIFDQYENDEHGFAKTHVPVRLARYGDEQLISRSQARRVLSRFEKFSEVMLDFRDVPRIGQAFADEIFRVFRREHPDVYIVPVRASQQVKEMIDHVLTSASVITNGPRDGHAHVTPTIRPELRSGTRRPTA